MRALRTDRGQLKVIKTGEGFLKAEVVFATPCVLPYFENGIQRNEAKLPEEVFRKETMDSASGVPVCDGHPQVNGQRVLVTPENYFQYIKGNLGNPKVDGYGATGLLTLYDSTLIREVQDKKKTQVSIGFTCELEEKSGMFNGVKYDAIQRNIIINHLAITDDARAGDATRILIDSKEGEKAMEDQVKTDAGQTGKVDASSVDGQTGKVESTDSITDPGKGRIYSYKTFDESKVIQIENKEIFEELQLCNKIAKEAKELMDAKKKAEEKKPDKKDDPENPDDAEDKEDEASKEKKGKMDEWKKELDALIGKVDEINGAVKKLKDAMPEMVESKSKEKKDEMDAELKKKDDAVKETINLMRIVSRIMPELKTDAMDSRKIKISVIQKALPGIYKADMTDAQIDASFEASLEVLRVKANQFDGNASRTLVDENSIRAEMEENKRKRLDVFGKSDKK